jgi:hypothetical protein
MEWFMLLPSCMRRFLCLALMLAVAAACESSSSEPSPQNIHPQPQPNDGSVRISAPCSASECGEAPSSLANPHCKPKGAGCSWSDDTSVSYRQCADAECGVAPSPNICPIGTTFRGNSCGSEDEEPCRWTTHCSPPPSTAPCPNADGCGPKPALAVICSDGGIGDLVCMEFQSRCAWQRTCD